MCSGKGLSLGEWVGCTLEIQILVPSGGCLWSFSDSVRQQHSVSDFMKDTQHVTQKWGQKSLCGPKDWKGGCPVRLCRRARQMISSRWSGAGAGCSNLAHSVWNLLHPCVGQHNQFTISHNLIFILVQSGV